MRLVFKIGLLVILTPILWRGEGGEVTAQNLVPNYSFEDTIPLNLSNPLEYIWGPEVANPWFTGYEDQSPDYFSATYHLSIGFSFIPYSFRGFQFAHTGVAHIGIATSNIWGNYQREFFTVPLINTLISNHTYFVQFYSNLADNSQVATNKLGAYLSVDTPNFINGGFIFQPQIENPQNVILSDTQNWVPVNGFYLATGGEKYLTIGNFYPNSQMDTSILNYGSIPESYYFIDDVSVVDCTATAINEISLQSEIKIYPNPVSENLTISVKEKYSINEIFIEITDGKTIIHQKQKHQKQKVIVDVAALPSATYIVRVVLNNGQVVKKVVKL